MNPWTAFRLSRLRRLEVEVAAGQVVFIEQELLQGMWRMAYRCLLRENAMKTHWGLRECKMLLPVEQETRPP
jgi:hypothetical protein